MRRVDCYCLFDITATGITHNRMVAADSQMQKARNQQRNWDTMLQLAGMRTQIFNIEGPTLLDSDASPFGSDKRTWKFSFEVEPESQWLVDSDDFWLLKQDSDGTPMITGLDESPDVSPMISTLSPEPNVIYAQGNK